MKKLLFYLPAMTIIGSCGGPEADMAETRTEQPKINKIEQVSWVLGNWQNETPEGTFTEHWERTSESLYSGHGFFVSLKGDTLFSEHIKLEAVNDTLYYKPVVSDQNDGKEVVFTEKSIGADEIVFENAAHDFPQRIVYRRPTDSTLHAHIEGKVNGLDKREEFTFKKAN